MTSKWSLYREKTCANPDCGIKHKNKGKYCSKPCSNTHRAVSQKQRDNMRKVSEDFKKTPEGVSYYKRSVEERTNLNPDDFAIAIPDISDISDYSDVLEGFDKAEKW